LISNQNEYMMITESETEQKREEEREASAVFAKLQSLKGPEEGGAQEGGE